MANTAEDRRSALLLLRVDGVPHLVVGPLLMAAVSPIESLTGVPRRTLAAFQTTFTAYGLLVVAGTWRRHTPAPGWLMPVAATANSAAVLAGASAMARRDFSLAGRLAGVGLAAGGIRMLFALRRP